MRRDSLIKKRRHESASEGRTRRSPRNDRWWRSDSYADASLKVEAPERRNAETLKQLKVKGQSFPHLSLSMLLKPGRMCLKLELRSSLGWLLVRFMEPFSRRLRKP